MNQFLIDIKKQAELEAAKTIASNLYIHPKVEVSNRGNGVVEVKSPDLPVHEVRQQAYIRSRANKSVYSRGRKLPRSFNNPIRSGASKYAGWQRTGRSAYPITYALVDPKAYILRKIREEFRRL